MNAEETDRVIKRMQARIARKAAEAEAAKGKESHGSRDYEKPKGNWSPFEEESAPAIAQLRRTMGPEIAQKIVADDRPRADKTPQALLWEAEVFRRMYGKEKGSLPDDGLPSPADNVKPQTESEPPTRPVEKLVNDEVDYKRWKRVSASIEEAHTTEHLRELFYHKRVLGRSHKEKELEEWCRKNPEPSLSKRIGDFEERYEAWRDARIEDGIKKGFLKRDEKNRVVAVEREKDRPGEKLVARRTRQGGRQDDGGRGGPE